MSSVTVSGYTNVHKLIMKLVARYWWRYWLCCNYWWYSSIICETSNLNQDGTVTINIPDGSTTVSIEITVTQNGSDYFGLDNLLVTGNQHTAIDGETVIIQNDAGGGSDVGISRLSFTSGNLTLEMI